MLEHPEIGWIERTGYPSWLQEPENGVSPEMKGGQTEEWNKTQWEVHYEKRQTLINGYARRCYQPRLTVVDKIIVYHPDVHRRYLQQHPCRGCGAERFCDTPCPVYLQWYNARMAAAKVRGGRSVFGGRFEITGGDHEAAGAGGNGAG